MEDKKKVITLSSMQLALLAELSGSHKPITSRSLANNLGLSSKTIRTYLATLDADLGRYGARVESKSGIGSWLEVYDRDKFADIKEYLDQYENIEAFADDLRTTRAHVIIRELLATDTYIKTESFKDYLFINSTSIKGILDHARSLLSRFGLTVVSKSRHGVKISGTEHDIRCAINSEFMHYEHCQLSLGSAESYDKYYLPREEALKIAGVIIDLRATYSDIGLSWWSILMIARSIYMWKVRNDMGYHLYYDDDTITKFTNRNCYYVARLIMNECGKRLDTKFTDNDVIYLAILLVGWRTMPDVDHLHPRSALRNKDIALEVVQHLHDLNNFTYFNKDLELIDSLALYTEGYLVRSHYHLFTGRFDASDMANTSIMAKKLAIQALVYMHRHYGGVVDAEEITYLSNLIRPYFGRYPHRRGSVKAAVVSKIDKLIGAMTKERIMRNYGGYFDRIDVLDIYELQERGSTGYDMIFTTCDIDRLSFVAPDVDIMYADVFFDEDFKFNLHKVLFSKTTVFGSSLAWILPKENVLQDVNAKNGYDVIMTLGRFLYPDDEDGFTKFIDELTYIDSVTGDRAKNNVVFLSGITPHTAKLTAVVLILKRSIFWGNAKAQVVVYWDCGKDRSLANYYENEFVPHDIEKVFRDRQVVDAILTGLNWQDLIMYMDEYRWKITSVGSSFR